MGRWQLTPEDGAALIARAPALAPVVAHFGLIAREVEDDSFTGLVRIILSQQLSDAAARKVWAQLPLEARCSPGALLALIEQGAPLPCTATKRQALATIARGFISGELSHRQLLRMSQDARHERLLAIKGVGPWSCAMFDLMVARERDCLLTGDLGVVRGLKLCLGLDLRALPRTARQRKEAQLKAQLSPVGSIATFYLWAASAARFSPRAEWPQAGASV